MKKFVKLFSFILILTCSVIFVGCKSKKDDLNSLSINLSTYNMDINFDNTSKSAYVEQTLTYVNKNVLY